MNEIAATVMVIAVSVVTAIATITGTLIGALVSGIFMYLAQKRTMEHELKREQVRLGRPRETGEKKAEPRTRGRPRKAG